MADSYLMTVEKSLRQHLVNTLPSETTVGEDVFIGRERFGHGDPDTMISILQAPDLETMPDHAGTGNVRKENKLYFIQGWVYNRSPIYDDQDPSLSSHLLLAEVKKSLSMLMDMNSSFFLMKNYNSGGNGLVSDIIVASGLVRPPDAQISPDASYFWLPVKLGILENIKDPYALP